MMLFVRKDEKVNFVDENDVVVGYDLEANCCECAGWFIADTPNTTSWTTEDENIDLDGWFFDTEYFQQQIGQCSPKLPFDTEGLYLNMAIFRMHNGDKEQFLHLYNCQNGYYSHGFTFEMDNVDLLHFTRKL